MITAIHIENLNLDEVMPEDFSEKQLSYIEFYFTAPAELVQSMPSAKNCIFSTITLTLDLSDLSIKTEIAPTYWDSYDDCYSDAESVDLILSTEDTMKLYKRAQKVFSYGWD